MNRDPIPFDANSLRARVTAEPDGRRLLRVKVTYSLGPDQMFVVDRQEPVFDQPLLENGSASRILRPSDLVTPTTRPEVFATGRVHHGGKGATTTVRVFAATAECSRTVGEAERGAALVLRAQSDVLDLDAPVVIEGLSPQNAYLATRIGRARPVAAATTAYGVRGVRLDPKLLFLDCERMIATVTWIGVLPGPDDAFEVKLAELSPGQDAEGRAQTVEISVPPPAAQSSSLPTSGMMQGLPFGRNESTASGSAAPPPVVPPPAPRATPPPAPRASSARTPPGPVEQPPPARLPTYLLPHQPESAPAPAAQPPPPVGELLAATKLGAAAASDAAASAEPPSASGQEHAAPTPAGTVPVRLTWVAEDKVRSICAWAAWRPLAPPPPEPPPPPPAPKRGQPPAPPPPPPAKEDEEDHDKRHLLRILQEGSPSRHARELATAPTVDATTPLILLDAPLLLPFDELEELKTTTSIAQQTAPSDNKRLKELLDFASEISKLPVSGSPDLVKQLTLQIQDAWEKSARSLPPRFLIKNVERNLIENRSYAKRRVFGGSHVRAILKVEDGEAPVYLPDAVTERLPLMASFRARLVAEAHPRVDAIEPAPVALLALALARATDERRPERR